MKPLKGLRHVGFLHCEIDVYYFILMTAGILISISFKKSYTLKVQRIDVSPKH